MDFLSCCGWQHSLSSLKSLEAVGGKHNKELSEKIRLEVEKRIVFEKQKSIDKYFFTYLIYDAYHT